MNNENGMMNGGDEYHDGDGQGQTKVCRDFMRNVCTRGKSCKFIHPQDIKIRTDPIFCHDFQQSKCFRSTCKFIHCSREEEDHYKNTGELPQGYLSSEISSYGTVIPRAQGITPGKQNGGLSAMGRANVPMPSNSKTSWGPEGWGEAADDVPICKDFLKGQCERPPGGCKFRHMDSQFRPSAMTPRRRPGPGAFYDSGPPEAKRSLGYTAGVDQYDDYYTAEFTSPPPPPPQCPQQVSYTTTIGSAPGTQGTYGLNEITFGRNGFGHGMVEPNISVQSYASASATSQQSMKALEDENFMLKRRIEELKKQVTDLTATNEYLLSQNAHFRLAKDSGTTASVVQTLVSMSQPLGMTMTTPLTSLPSVSMTSATISQQHPLPVVSMAQHPGQPQNVYPMVTTQGVLPPN